jgi:hypothetical protein
MPAFGAPWGCCQRCDQKVRLNELRKEWTGLRVCGPCHDPRPDETRPPRYRPEGIPLPNASPETTPIFRADGDVGGDDL